MPELEEWERELLYGEPGCVCTEAGRIGWYDRLGQLVMECRAH